MKVKYHLSIESNCPVDGQGDFYECCLTSDKPLAVEQILEVVKDYKNRCLFQEHLAEELSRKLLCKVKLVGYHSGVKVSVKA